MPLADSGINDRLVKLCPLFTLLADEKLTIIFIVVAAIFSVEYLIPQNY